MILLTPELREQLLANGRDRDADHIPVVKFLNPLGEGARRTGGIREAERVLHAVHQSTMSGQSAKA